MDQYEPIKVLGEGSFGKVYLMKHCRTRDLVCTKAKTVEFDEMKNGIDSPYRGENLLQALAFSDKRTTDTIAAWLTGKQEQPAAVVKLKNIPPREQEACRNEVGLMRRMSHPNIVGYIDSFIYKNCLCIIMEYCDAGDLGDRVNGAKGRLLSESKIMTWFVQVALGLHYMHTHRILHRDIKTQNVFILSCGRVVLGDLGISKILGGTRDFARTCIGTPYYMSPEIFKNNPYNDKSDIWALGCLLYELLTLRHAFDSQSLNGLAGKIIKGKFPPVSSSYSNNVRCLVKDMLSTNPKRRPNTEQILRKIFVQAKVREFVNDLKMDTLPCQERAMGSLCDQLRDLRMEDFMPLDQPIMEEDEGGYDVDEGGPNAPSPSQSDPALTASTSSRSSASGFLSFFRAQKHQLEVEEEKRIAAEMALSRLHRKAAERRQRLSFCRSPSPQGEGRSRDSMSPKVPNSPPVSPERAARDMTVPPSSDSRRPSLLQRLGHLATNQRRKSLTNQGSPAGVGSPDSVGSPGERRASRAPLGSAKGTREVVDAVAAAAAQATQVERDSEERIPEGGARASGRSPARQPRRSFSRPKAGQEAIPYVYPYGHDQTPTSIVSQPSPSGDSVFSADEHDISRGTESPPRQEPTGDTLSPPQQARRTLEQSKVDTGSIRNDRSLDISASRGARSISPGQNAERRTRDAMDSMYEDEDLFSDLKKQTREHDIRGEDSDVHNREEELKRMLKDAEQRCQDLREGLEKARALSGRQEPISTGPPSPDSLSVEPAVLEGMGLAPLRTKEDSPIPSAIPCAVKQENRQDTHVSSQPIEKVLNFEDEPSPYCKSNLEGLQDPSSPIGKLVDRQEFLRQRCREGLGEGKFERAMQLLRSLQEGDCKVTVGGIQYDGNDVEQVEAVLVTIIGRHKIHYWSFMNQLLLMS